jgi:acyl-CoA thioesterase FadM
MMELGRVRDWPLTLQAEVEPRFIDAMGHMNVAWYVHLFDRAVWVYFARLGLDERYLQSTERGLFAVEENLRYLSELREGAAVDVHTGLLEARPKTLRVLEYMVDRGQQRVAAVREVVAVHIDLRTRRSIELEPQILARIEAEPRFAPPEEGLTEASAQSFARAWIEAWNRRDIEAVLSHYADDAVFVSPKAERIVGSSRVEGKRALRAYWATALAQIPALHFSLDAALWSPRGQALTVLYRSQRGTAAPVHAAEIMRFRAGQIVHGEALYGGVVAG